MDNKDQYCFGFEREVQYLGALKRGAGGDRTSSIVVITPSLYTIHGRNTSRRLYTSTWQQRRDNCVWTRTMALHDSEELDNDLRRRTDENLALATALGVDDVVLETD